MSALDLARISATGGDVSRAGCARVARQQVAADVVTSGNQPDADLPRAENGRLDTLGVGNRRLTHVETVSAPGSFI